MKAIFLLISFLLLFSFILSGSNIEVRFAPIPSPLTDRLTVKVEVRNTANSRVILADQNYRLYYDSEKVIFDTESSSSSLSRDQYGEMDVFEHLSDLMPIGKQEKMGFINFSIQLKDLIDGGVKLSPESGWLSVATLYFDITAQDIDNHKLIWSRDGVTDHYASAFVHMTEWKAPRVVESLDIDYYHDASIADLQPSHDYITARVGPNPTSDYIRLDLEMATAEILTVHITDMSGRKVKETRIERGEESITIDISDLISSSYVVVIYNQDNLMVHSDKIIVALP